MTADLWYDDVTRTIFVGRRQDLPNEPTVIEQLMEVEFICFPNGSRGIALTGDLARLPGLE